MGLTAEWVALGRPANERLAAVVTELKGGDPLGARDRHRAVEPGGRVGPAVPRAAARGSGQRRVHDRRPPRPRLGWPGRWPRGQVRADRPGPRRCGAGRARRPSRSLHGVSDHPSTARAVAEAIEVIRRAGRRGCGCSVVRAAADPRRHPAGRRRRGGDARPLRRGRPGPRPRSSDARPMRRWSSTCPSGCSPPSARWSPHSPRWSTSVCCWGPPVIPPPTPAASGWPPPRCRGAPARVHPGRRDRAAIGARRGRRGSPCGAVAAGASRRGHAVPPHGGLLHRRRPYRRALHRHLEAAGITSNGPSMVTVGETIAGRFVRLALALAGSPTATRRGDAARRRGPDLRSPTGVTVRPTMWDSTVEEGRVSSAGSTSGARRITQARDGGSSETRSREGRGSQRRLL